MNARLLGRWGEAQAAEYLRKKHYGITAMNYRCRLGELDIVAENRAYIVFVEVKLRKNADFAEAAAFVTGRKQQRLQAAAQLFLAGYETAKQPRFDVIEIYAPAGADPGRIRINHLENVF